MLVYSNNGFSMRAVEDNYSPASGEVVFQAEATDEQLETAFPGYTAQKQAAGLQAQLSTGPENSH
jgi:hypothetical protein